MCGVYWWAMITTIIRRVFRSRHASFMSGLLRDVASYLYYAKGRLVRRWPASMEPYQAASACSPPL